MKTRTPNSRLSSIHTFWNKTLWLAEDELRFSRIMTFVYGQFFLNVKLRETTNTTKNTLLVLSQLLVSLQVVTALLMSPHEHAVEVINRHIKVFLSCYHRFCQLHYAVDKVPFWLPLGTFTHCTICQPK